MKRKAPTTPGRLAAVLEIVLAAPCGIERRELAKQMGLSDYQIKECLYYLRDNGQIGTPCRGGRGSYWMSAAEAAKVRASYMTREARREAERAKQDRRDERENEAFLAGRRRVVAALHAAPLLPAAPRSVFDVAMMLEAHHVAAN